MGAESDGIIPRHQIYILPPTTDRQEEEHVELPSDDRKAEDGAEPPDFDALDDPADIVRGGRTRDQIYTTVLQVTEPATVAEIAERAGPGPDATREYLRWFADIGLVRRTDATPERYVVNRAFLRWRRAHRLSEAYDEPELVGRLQDVIEEIDTYRETYDAESPSEIVVASVADRRNEPVADVWREVSAWETARERRHVLELALHMRRSAGQPAGVVGGGVPPDDDPVAGR